MSCPGHVRFRLHEGCKHCWRDEGRNPRYLNLLVTGDTVLLERIGFRGGRASEDYEHISPPDSFRMVPDQTFAFSIPVSRHDIGVVVQGDLLHRAWLSDSIDGRVGLRAWRSTLECTRFEVESG